MSARREHPLFLFDNRTVEKAQVPLVHPLHIRYSFLSNYVYDIGQADDGRLWVCTQMGGVSILDPQALSSGDVRFDNIGAGQRDGISSANARCFFQDSFGNIWIGNYRQGIDFLSYERPIFRTLLPTGSSTDASGANQVWSLAVDNRSLLWAGCENRLVAFDGEREAFTLELTGLASPNTHDENTFHIAFNVMDYTRSRQVEYAYLMEGLHTAWFENGNDHRVMFRNLPPGTYTFRVKARLRNQPWRTADSAWSVPTWASWYRKSGCATRN